MTTITLWHNPRCSKSRQALALLRDHGVEPRIVEYLREPPDVAELERVLDLLGVEPRAAMRPGEETYAQLGLDDPALDHRALIAALAAQPILIERPIAIAGSHAVIARPPERVLELLPPSH